MTKFIAKIDELNTVRIWAEYDLENDLNSSPLIIQDVHPDGRPWENKDEAQIWADDYIVKLESYVPSPIEEITE
jgi:hypothetical protein